MENSTNWVTIKIPEPTRDEAREDPRTYEDIMKAGLGDGSNSGGVEIDTEAIASEIADRVETNGGVGPEQISREVARQLDYAEIAQAVADELEGRFR